MAGACPSFPASFPTLSRPRTEASCFLHDARAAGPSSGASSHTYLMATMTVSTSTPQLMATQPCRFCGAKLHSTFVDLGFAPLCETYPAAKDFKNGEMYYPLHVYTCEKCVLVQLEEYEKAENIFSDYLYFSSYSDSWLKHC